MSPVRIQCNSYRATQPEDARTEDVDSEKHVTQEKKEGDVETKRTRLDPAGNAKVSAARGAPVERWGPAGARWAQADPRLVLLVDEVEAKCRRQERAALPVPPTGEEHVGGGA